jgi:5-methyltetrahydropteroyltriglutamate--homocysteine methyltransferase
MVGCLNLEDPSIESPVVVASRVKRALQYISPEQVILAPDCGMKYLPREVADGKLRAMTEAAKILRAEYSR